MTYTRSQWARDFLSGLGNNNPSQNVINWVINWTAAEGSSVGGQGSFNLLNTTQPMPGSYGGGSQGNIQYFSSYSSGIQANDIVIKNGLYPDLLSALKNNDESALGFGGSMSSGVQHDLSIWCGGCGYGGWFAHQSPSSTWLSQLFPGDATGSTSSGGTINLGTSGSGSSSTSSSSSGGIGQDILNGLGLPSPEVVKDFAERFMIIGFGGLIILVGIMVLFFSSKPGQEAASNAGKAAETAAMA